MPKVSLLAYAKINLTLDVLKRRSDGYHEIESVMLPISLADYVILETAAGMSLETSGPYAKGLPDPGEDLAMRAAWLLKNRIGYQGGCAIRLQKNIPLAAGMGGGSSDAAAVLFGLNWLWGAGLSQDELLGLSGELGSDVPFCLLSVPAVARGRGEILEALNSTQQLNLVLVKPPVPKSTGAVYQRLDLERLAGRPDTAGAVRNLMTGDLPALTGSLGNVLEPVLSDDYPKIGEVIRWLENCGATGVRMTGAGPTVFGLAGSLPQAKQIAARAGRRLQDCDIFVAQTLV